ncbi:TetR/AcrR family transcriptional regulator [Rhodococcus gannanensis]|uniref:TetR/AcrR family transcriptional regulator n=1 Tax=Rhodococcus gannanensis TaxID=1960308 RepID=A0ABW4PBS7_9NOCA
MPKVIDVEQRQQDIAEAVWRVLLRDGITAVSVRDVAAEAGLSPGSLRHTFASKAELLAYSMQLVHRRAEERAYSHSHISDPRDRAIAIISEVLPLDETRRSELEVNLALVAEAPAHPELGEIARRAQHALREGLTILVADMKHHGLCAQRRNVADEARHLHALLTGASMHAMVGDQDNPASALKMVTDHIDSLAR